MLTRKKLQLVKFSESERRIGESAPDAILTDHEVELMRQMHEECPIVQKGCATGELRDPSCLLPSTRPRAYSTVTVPALNTRLLRDLGTPHIHSRLGWQVTGSRQRQCPPYFGA